MAENMGGKSWNRGTIYQGSTVISTFCLEETSDFAAMAPLKSPYPKKGDKHSELVSL
jgi:hypothetical protein